ncbi:4-hydroxy-3-methylbut-2-enyl diphosphate reductase [Desulfosporosinus sp. Tol-M]|nr:4-hydroxy-3-methylbut-2-enyl diphosphate reductase [Desulfosporosinus sp. Tol-M]
MKVKLAAKAGFCFGVKRALDMAERTVETSSAVSLGPLIHNQQVVKRLAEQGIHVVQALDEVLAEQTLIIRSHGVGPSVYQGAENIGIQVVDATCPFVQKAQRLAAESARRGQQVIVMGDKLHPEVQGILGWAGKQALSLQTLEEAKELPFYPQLAVLAQTTQLAESFAGIVEELKLHTEDLTVHNTICNATAERQKAARELAQTVDVMVVVGGRNSANTQKLASICAELTKTYLIETAEELEADWFKEAKSAGLTAGASSPDWIIEEVYQTMFEMNENEMDMANWLGSFQNVHLGARVTGKVVKITNDEIFVDIGWKSEGIIPFTDEKGIRQIRAEDLLSIGDEVAAVVIRVENEEGYTVLSKRQADEEQARERLEKFAESKEEIQAKVVEVVKGGLLVDVGIRGFVPASQLQLGYVEDLNQFLGQTLRLRIIEFDPAKRKVVLSQKIILEEEQANKRRHLLETLQVGDIVTGVVRRIADFGAFVDIGGLDGLLHISEMAYARIRHPSEILKTGDVVEVQVLKFEHDTGKLSLGLKQLQENPWVRVAEKYPIDSIVKGVVVRIVPFGAFVGLADGVDGLLHISQLADHRVNKVEEVLKVGDQVSAKVIECKPEAKRLSLSMREMVKDIAQAGDNEAIVSQSENNSETINDALDKDHD